MFSMDKLDDEYWLLSATKGFDFGSEENVQAPSADIFGATAWQTAELSRQVQQNIPHQVSSPQAGSGTHVKLSQSLSSLSTGSNSSYRIQKTIPSKQCEVTSKLLSSTINEEAVLSPKDVVRSLFLGMSTDLSCFKKLTDKTLLLDEALKIGDGDTVCAVLLFLQKSLHQMVLFSLLKERPVAAQEYVALLEKQKAFHVAATLSAEMHQPKEAAIFLYNSCFRVGDQNLQNALEQLNKNELKRLKNVEVESETVKEHIQLLERQYPIALNKPRIQHPETENTKTSSLIGKPVTTGTLVGSSLLATLEYCCRYNWDAPENLLASPTGLKKAFNLSEKEFIWNAFTGRILSGNDPVPILLMKGMFGAPKVAGGLSITRILQIASALNNSLPSIFDQLITLIESSEKKLQLAKRYQRHRIVIDVLISNKDRVGLIQYKDSLNDSIEIDYINNTLRVSSTRWKN